MSPPEPQAETQQSTSSGAHNAFPVTLEPEGVVVGGAAADVEHISVGPEDVVFPFLDTEEEQSVDEVLRAAVTPFIIDPVAPRLVVDVPKLLSNLSLRSSDTTCLCGCPPFSRNKSMRHRQALMNMRGSLNMQ